MDYVLRAWRRGRILESPDALEATLIGPSYKGENKWLRGITAPNGKIYFLPACADQVLVCDARTDEVRCVGEKLGGERWRYHGGVLAKNGLIFGVPCNAEKVICIDTTREDDVISFVGPAMTSRQKWYGGLLGKDGCFYAIPQNHSSVLKVDPETREATLLGEFPESTFGKHKWHGGTVVGRFIVGIPSHASCVLIVDTAKGTAVTVGHLEGDDFGYLEGNAYKYLGAVTRGDACYFMPGFARRVLKVVPSTGEVGLVGPDLSDKQNKWQNGYLGPDGAIYGIPVNARSILRIDAYDNVTTVQGVPDVLEAYEGGVEVNGSLICCPMRARCVMKVTPRK